MLKFKSLKWLFAILCLFSFINGYSQADQVISSGNTVSSFICGNKQIYTMGAGVGGGSTPIKVNIFDETNNLLFAKQVSSGSGATFAALDCYSDAWAWGDNTNGQVGNGTTSTTAVATPVRVKASSVIKSANKKTISGTDYLTNVSVIYTANLNSYAILNDGTLASWGKNSNVALGALYSPTGQLGDGTTVDKLTAVLVIDGSTNLPLDSVTQVYATDNATFALSNGKVYSWGNGQNGSLGRNATGGKWIADVTSSTAYTVAFPTETGKIVKIAAGDVIGMALDEFGYVWTWGNGGWNQATGWGTSITSGVPQRVVKGTTITANGDNDGTYLLAKDIDGGQGFAMAVTKSGAPVAWGGGGCGVGGGVTGNGTLTGSPTGGPGYILTGAAIAGVLQYDKDVVNICRGDHWGFYVTKNNTIKTWGCNTNGQLGLGNITSQPYAVIWTPVTDCIIRDPYPSAYISTPDTTVCASTFGSLPITLKASFVIDPTLANNYKVTWYKNSGASPNNVTIVKGDATTVSPSTNTFPATAANLSLSVTSPGKYNVEIAYVGRNGGCSIYPIAKDSLTISTFPQSFTAPTTLTYCGDSANVFVNSTSLTKPIYSWYPSPIGTTPILGTSITSISNKIPLNNITNSGNGDKVVYVEETSGASGTILKKSEGCAPTWFTGNSNLSSGNINIDQTFATGYTVYKKLTITQLSTMFSSSVYIVGQTGTATLNFAIYGSKQNNGGYIADASNIKGTLSATYTRTRTASETQDLIVELKLKGNVTLDPGIYFIGPSSFTVTGNLFSPIIGRGSCTLPAGIVDDVDGSFIKQNAGISGYANPNQNSTGFDFNIGFKTSQQFCDRLPVTLSNPYIFNDTIVGNKTVLSNSSGNKYSVKAIPNLTYSWTYSGQNATITNNGNEIEIAMESNATSGDLTVVSTNNCITSTRKISLTINSITSTDDINASSPTKQLSNIYNIQGIEVSKNYKGLVIYKYTDGTTEKRIQE